MLLRKVVVTAVGILLLSGCASTTPEILPEETLPSISESVAPEPAPVVEAPAPAPEPAPVVEAPAPAPEPAPVVEAPVPAAPVVSYSNCDEVKAAGKAPLAADQPGYASKLDRDGDGIACDK
jgi:hypothetical protein